MEAPSSKASPLFLQQQLAAVGWGINTTGWGIQATLFWSGTGKSFTLSFLVTELSPALKIFVLFTANVCLCFSPYLDNNFPYGRLLDLTYFYLSVWLVVEV